MRKYFVSLEGFVESILQLNVNLVYAVIKGFHYVVIRVIISLKKDLKDADS